MENITMGQLGQFLSISSGPVLCEVDENDEIYMGFVTDSGSTLVVSKSTYITIEVIK